MKKTLAFLLALMLLFSLSATAIAETSGSQTITLTVPDSTATELSPTVIMTLPVFGEHPNNTATPGGDYASYFEVTGITFSKGGTALTDTDVFEAGEYTISITVHITGNDYIFSTSSAAVVSLADDLVVIFADQTDISSDGKYATYTFTYTVDAPPSPSWTLTIPANMTIEYSAAQTEIDLFNDVSIGNIENLPDTQQINAYFQFTGSFVNDSDSSKTIPFTVLGTTTSGSSVLEAGSNHLIKYTHWVDLVNSFTGWDTGEVITSASINITPEAWSAAAPGTYTTTFTYSSSIGS